MTATRVVAITAHGGPEVLAVQERPAAKVGPADVAIDVRAAGVNFADILVRMGMYPEGPEPPCVPGLEVAGVISELGSAVGGIEIGEPVLSGTKWGGYADRVVVPAHDVIQLPRRGITFEQATAIPVNYATAWSALVEYGGLKPGQKVLIQAAAGGVGTASIQIARLHGGLVYGTASPGKHDVLRELGVEEAIDYTQEGWEEGLPEFDIVIDGVGGESFKKSYALLRTGGRLIAIGSASLVSGYMRSARFNVLRQMTDSKSVIGLNVLKLWTHYGTGAPWIEALFPLMRNRMIQPIVDSTLPFERAAEAHLLLAERRNIGKVVLRP